MISMRSLFICLTVMFFLCGAAAAQELESIDLGYGGLYRPGEWTPLRLTVNGAPAGAVVAVEINRQVRFHAPYNGPSTTMYVFLGKSTANEIEVKVAGKTVYSSLRGEDSARLWMAAVPSEHRLVGICLTTNEPMPLPEERLAPLRAAGVHLFNLFPADLPMDPFLLESVDHIILNDLIESQLDAPALEMLQRWQAGSGRVTNINTALAGGPQQFLSWLAETEALRVVRHADRCYDADAYDLFDAPPYAGDARRRAAQWGAGLLLGLVLCLWALPSRLPRVAVGLMCGAVALAAWGIHDYGAAVTGLDKLASLHSEQMSILEWTGEAWDETSFVSLAPRRSDARILRAQNLRLKPVWRTSSDDWQTDYERREAMPPRLLPGPLKTSRRYLVSAHTQHRHSGLRGAWEKDGADVENTTGQSFQDAFLVVEGKLYRAPSMVDGSHAHIVPSEQVPWKKAFKEEERLDQYRLRLLRYWKDTRMRLERVYFIGFGPQRPALELGHQTGEGCALYFTEVIRPD